MARRFVCLTIVLFVLMALPAMLPLRAFAEEKDAAEELTPAILADRIEAAMRQYDSIEYAITSTHQHSVKGTKPATLPVRIESEERRSYRTDGVRWRFEETGDGVSVDPGSLQATLFPRYEVSGFDGHVTYRADDRTAWIGEKPRDVDRNHPRNLLWPGTAETIGRDRVPRMQTFLELIRRPEARITGSEKVGNRECIRVESEWRNGASSTPLHRVEAMISPEQSYLPLSSVWSANGRVYRHVQLQGLKQTTDGLWYPMMIRTIGATTSPPAIERVTLFEHRAAGSANPFRDEDFRYIPVFGIDVVDYRFGIAWHNDPWWADLDPTLVQGLNRPEPTVPAPPPPVMGTGSTNSIFGLVDPDWKAIEADWKRRVGEAGGTARIVGKVTLANAPGLDDGPEDRLIEVRAVPCLRLLDGKHVGRRKTISDADRAVTVPCGKSGAYAIEGLRKGTWILTVSSRGYLSVERELVLGSDEAADGWDVTLTEDRIAGVVVDAEGKPIIGADVLHRRWRRQDPLHPAVSMESRYPPVREVANPEGRFRFDKLKEGTYWIEFSADGFEPRTVEGVAAGDVSVKVVLEKKKTE